MEHLKCTNCESEEKLIRFEKAFGLKFLSLNDKSGEVYCKRCYSNINGISRANLSFNKDELEKCAGFRD